MSELGTKVSAKTGLEAAAAVPNSAPEPTTPGSLSFAFFKSGPSLMEGPAFRGAAMCFVVFSILIDGFFSIDTLSAVLLVSAQLGIVATGVGLLLTGRGFDLSVGAVFALAGGMTVVGINIGLVPTFTVAAVLTGAGIIGALNGYLVTRLKVHSLLVTLGTMLICHAVVAALMQSQKMQLNGYYWSFGLFDFRLFGAIPISVVWMVMLVLLAALGVGRTRFGNWIYATGADPLAAYNLGVPVTAVRLQSFAIASLMAALAGVMSIVQTGNMALGAGDALALEALLAALVGGVRLSDGRGTVSGIICAVLALKMSQQALVMVGGDPVWYRTGVMVALVLITFRFLQQRQEV